MESPDTYQLFAAMSTMGAIIGRKCWFDNDIFRIYPMQNLLLIGPSGIGKSTCVMLARRMLKALREEEQPQIIASGTKEKIHSDLVVSPKAILVASELANFFNRSQYMEGMIPYMTQLLDYEDTVELRTKGGGILRIQEPAVTVIGASTVDWLQDQLPESAGTGGFLARFLIVAEEFKKQRVALPGVMFTPTETAKLEALRNRALWEFRQVMLNVPDGPIPLQSYEVADCFSNWYVNQKSETGYLAPFIERSREIVLRLGMLLSLSKGAHEIELEDVESAIKIYEIATAQLKSVIIPMSPDGKQLLAVLKAVGKGEMSYKQLYSALAAMATDRRVDLLIESHLRSGALIKTTEGKLRRNRGVY